MYAFLGRPRELQDKDGGFYISDDEHIIVRIGFLGLAAGFILYMMGTAQSILRISNVTDRGILRLVEGFTNILQWIVYLFMAYLFIYLLYYLYNRIMSSSETLGRRLR
ncbi:hypothetical protein LCGC14_0534870 [marine sediment metagenome]|uniref:Uncharacterized protein n=1 Tax=marine sediment metagenome TaxID=412755 RepID=A0A0F9UG32_9ZZZZ